MLPPNRWLWCVLALSGAAFAQAPKPVVMPFPLELKRVPTGFSKEDSESLQRDFTRLLRKTGAGVPDFGKFDLALKELKRQDCEREDECLVQLAKRAEALYGLYASIDYTLEGAVVASGRVVRDDGKPSRPTQTVKILKGKDSFGDVSRNALTQLFEQLKIASLEPVRPVETAVVKEPVKDPVIGPPPPLPPVIPEDTHAGQRSAGKGLLFTGVGLVVVGAALAATGGGLGYTAQQTGGIANNPEAAKQAATGQALATAGFVTLGVGAVAGGIGAALWAMAGPPPSTQVSVVPVNGGGVVQFGGSF